MDYLPFKILFNLEITWSKRVNILIKWKTRHGGIVKLRRRNIRLFLFFFILNTWTQLISSISIIVIDDISFLMTLSDLEVFKVSNNFVLAVDNCLKMFISLLKLILNQLHSLISLFLNTLFYFFKLIVNISCYILESFNYAFIILSDSLMNLGFNYTHILSKDIFNFLT